MPRCISENEFVGGQVIRQCWRLLRGCPTPPPPTPAASTVYNPRSLYTVYNLRDIALGLYIVYSLYTTERERTYIERNITNTVHFFTIRNNHIVYGLKLVFNHKVKKTMKK